MSDALDSLARCESSDLIQAALEIARDEYPTLNVDQYRARLNSLVAEFLLFRGNENEPELVLEQLNQFFFGVMGFAGNRQEYYDPRNSYLNEVIDRRKGIPITLSVIYQRLAASAGILLDGVNLPGHFMLAYTIGPCSRRHYIDVFHGGVRLQWIDCLQQVRSVLGTKAEFCERDFPAMSPREIMVRMLRNLKSIYSHADLDRCLRVQRRIAQLLPDDPAELRDLGLLYYHTRRIPQAYCVFAEVLRRFPKRAESEIIRKLMRQSVSQLSIAN